mmetsp:Transcript_20233/g.43744  ORF Transcript_20233/g.43744 Transcript_20233/m.43744 type:complete len:273 (-) Transcript_20233:19-837(-)
MVLYYVYCTPRPTRTLFSNGTDIRDGQVSSVIPKCHGSRQGRRDQRFLLCDGGGIVVHFVRRRRGRFGALDGGGWFFFCFSLGTGLGSHLVSHIQSFSQCLTRLGRGSLVIDGFPFSVGILFEEAAPVALHDPNNATSNQNLVLFASQQVFSLVFLNDTAVALVTNVLVGLTSTTEQNIVLVKGRGGRCRGGRVFVLGRLVQRRCGFENLKRHEFGCGVLCCWKRNFVMLSLWNWLLLPNRGDASKLFVFAVCFCVLFVREAVPLDVLFVRS